MSASISSVSTVSASAIGIDAALDVGHVGVLEAAQHVGHRVHLADVGQELVAEPLALGGAAHQAGDVDEGEAGRDVRAEPAISASLSRRGSGTPTSPTLGSMVQNG